MLKTYELYLYPPNSPHLHIYKWKTAEASSIEEFAEICDNDTFTNQLLNNGWRIADIREIK